MKKRLKVVPKPPKETTKSTLPEGDPLITKEAPRVIRCPPEARRIVQQRVNEVAVAQRRLRETVETIAASLGIDIEKEKWNFDADHYVFTRIQ